MNTLKVSSKDIDIFASLECGQIFRFNRVKDNEYIVYSLDKKCCIKKVEDFFVLETNSLEYFNSFFALDINYNLILEDLNKTILKNYINENTPKIRILKQDPTEMIFSFIISANNNIPRIKKIIEKLCESLGKNNGDYFAFPSVEKLANQTEEFYRSLGLGYRATYILNTAKILNTTLNVNALYDMTTDDARKQLLTLPGVGPKVADCILLFGYNKYDVFPVDTWIKKVYVDIYNDNCENITKMRNNLMKEFGEFAGVAQQYLFFLKKSLDI